MNRFHIRNWNYKYFLIILISFLIYWQTTSFDFVWDDMGVHLGDNPYLRRISFFNLLYFWQEPYKGMYIPITYMLWALIKFISQLFDYQQPFNPEFYHTVNIIVHTINGILVFELFRKVTKNDWASILASLLFIVHPIQVEAVAWVSETRGLLSTCFGLVAILFYFYQRESLQNNPITDRKYRTYSWFFFLLAILSKPSSVVIPGLILVLDRYYFARSWRDSFYTIIPFIALIIPIVLVTTSSQHPQNSYPLIARPLIWMDTINFYILKLVYPIHLVASYGRHLTDIIDSSLSLVFLVFPILLGYLFWRLKSRANYLWISFMWVIIGYLPVSGLVSFIFQDFSNVADRFFYISMIGVSLGFATVLSQMGRRSTYVITFIFLIFLGLRSALYQVPIWKNSLTLWNHNMRYAPSQAFIYHNRGTAYLDQKKYYLAIRDFTVTINIDSLSVDSYNNRGKAFKDLGFIDLAEEDYNMAIKINPRYALAYFNRAVVYNEKKQIDLAYNDCRQAIDLAPLDPEAWNLLGILDAEKDNYNRALVSFSKAINLDPYFDFAYHNRGKVYRKLNKYKLAFKDLNSAIKINPRKAANYYRRGILQLLVNEPAKAIKDFTQAISLYHDYSAASILIAIAYYQIGDMYNAQQYIEMSQRTSPSPEDSTILLQLRKVGLLDDSLKFNYMYK